MRLHSLSFSAFGSFGGTETVDFDQLAHAGLFLLHGPTGAGKTTVLDAVSFALFGTVAGVRPGGGGLRSHHGEPSTPTEVRLEVTLDGRRFRIVRRPRQVRPKLRGEGMVEDSPTATVQELVAGSWVPRAAKPNEADPYLQEHLHMGVNQFHQIVMLPQGDFARFLRANADERRLVLEELFATHRFAEIERWLRNRADADRAAVAEADDRARDALVAAATVADVTPFPKDEPLTEATRWLAEVMASAGRQGEAAAAVERAARTVHTKARSALADAVALGERQQRLTVARATRAQLDERADQHTADRARRDAALRAAPLLPLIEQFTHAGARSRELSGSVAAYREVLAAELPDLTGADRGELSDHDESFLRDLGQVTDLLTDEQLLDERERGLGELAAQLGALDEALSELEDERETVPDERARVGDGLDAARQRAARGHDIAERARLLTTRHEAAIERDRLEIETAAASLEHEAASRAELDAQKAWLERFQAQLASRAAALAEALEDGHPCPVCGSAEHPAPASGDGSPVSDDDVAAAKERFDHAAAQGKRVRETVAKLDTRLATASATAGEGTAEELAATVADHQQLRLEAAAAGALVPELEARAKDLDARAATIVKEIRVLHKERAALDKRRSVREGALTADRERIVRARGGFITLADRADRLHAHRVIIGDLLTALDQLAQADQAVLDALELAEREATRRGFADVTEAGAAALDADVLAELIEAIEAHERSLTETDAELRHPDLLAAAALDPVDVELAEAVAAEADRDLELASITAGATRKASDRLERIHTDVERQLVELGPKLETYERTRHLADLASGDDRQVEHRMRLSTYVLAARLEQVAAAASERLHRMSNGRYTIVHTDEAPDGRRKGGLGLRVVDAWTSTERETSTLSGGESFFTSLALALGVADVVCAETGGVTMETMFIDEGFGSLDDDTLQDVMDVLDGLRAGGRTVGVVSHVSDLRTRISSQLEVVKSSAGSRLRTTGPASRAAETANTSTAA